MEKLTQGPMVVCECLYMCNWLGICVYNSECLYYRPFLHTRTHTHTYTTHPDIILLLFFSPTSAPDRCLGKEKVCRSETPERIRRSNMKSLLKVQLLICLIKKVKLFVIQKKDWTTTEKVKHVLCFITLTVSHFIKLCCVFSFCFLLTSMGVCQIWQNICITELLTTQNFWIPVWTYPQYPHTKPFGLPKHNALTPTCFSIIMGKLLKTNFLRDQYILC